MHEQVLPVGTREYLFVTQILAQRARWERDELRACLASILATDPEQWGRVSGLFDVYVPTLLPKVTPAAPGFALPLPEELVQLHAPALALAGERRRQPWQAFRAQARQRLRRTPTLIWSVALALVLLPVLVLLLWGIGRVREPSPEPVVAARHPATPRGGWTSSVGGGGAGLGLVLLVLGFRLLLLPGVALRARRVGAQIRGQHAMALRRHLAEAHLRAGLSLRPSYRVPSYPSVSREAIQDSAALLGRIYRQDRGIDLDVPATLHATLREAGRLVPIFQPRRRAREILVFIDREGGGHPFSGGLLRLLDAWRQAGVHLLCYRYDRWPSSLTPEGALQPQSLAHLARIHEEAVVLLLSRRLSQRTLRGTAEWVKWLPVFPLCAQIDPDPRPIEQRSPDERRDIAEMEGLGLARFPLSDRGILALARHLASGGLERPPSWDPLPNIHDPVVSAALSRWAQAAALVPDASWDQIEEFRRSDPKIHAALPTAGCVRCLLDWMVWELHGDPEQAEPEDFGAGGTLGIPAQMEDRLIRGLRESDLVFEREVRQLLVRQLGEKPPEDELTRWHWLLKREGHLALLEPETALARMAQFMGSPVETEARAFLDPELQRQEDQPLFASGDRELLRVLLGEGRGVALADVLRPHRGLWLQAAALAVAVLLVVALGLRVWMDPPKRPGLWRVNVGSGGSEL